MIDGLVTNALNKFRNQPSIIMIKNKKNDQKFSFGPVTYYDVLKKIKLASAKTQKRLSNLVFQLTF